MILPTLARSRQRGVALVIVLAMVALIAALAIGFLNRAGSNRSAAASYGATATTRQIADNTVNIVQGQINLATQLPAGSVWASQPGAIRTFKSDGSLDTIYRLYSASSLTASNYNALATDVPSANWASAPAIWVDLNAPAVRTGTSSLSYPILDPRSPTGSGLLNLDGFALTNPPGSSSSQPVPMPVRWLYVLRNGEIIAPDNGGSGQIATFANSNVKPSADNPIVGRTAFWTDDESCKINVNTAGDGTFWDTPHVDAPDEHKLANSQPMAREFNRYPGHPATTSLKAVFTALGVDLGTYPSAMGQTSNLFKLLPRYNDDYGSKQGTATTTASSNPVTAKSGRFYSGTGEMLFSPARTSSGLTLSQTEVGKFFLTATSRAPELNLFGQPRIATWPVSENSSDSYRTPVDRLIAFASTINGKPYYFTRLNPRSTTVDISLNRNQELLNYLDRSTQRNVPGVGKSFVDKYGQAETRQILTEIFDYIRCMNLRDSTLSETYQYATRSPSAASNETYGLGEVTPSISTSWGTQGFGRFYRITEVALVFVAVGEGSNGSTSATPVLSSQAGTVGYTGSLPGFTPANSTRAVQAFLVMNFFDPNFGWSSHYPNANITVSGLNSFKLNNQSMAMPGSASIPLFFTTPPLHSRAYGGPLDWRVLLRKFGPNSPPKSGAYAEFPFYSKILEIPTGPGSMDFSGGKLTIQLYDEKSNLVSTYDIDFPSYSTLPIPSLPVFRQFGVNLSDLNDRFGKGSALSNNFPTTLIDPADVVFGVVPSKASGDYRLLARTNVPSSVFVRHPSAGTQAQGFGFDTPVLEFSGSIRGTLYDPALLQNRKPFVPATVQGAFVGGSSNIPGDWDNGFGRRLDGPFINKPDEGTIYNAGTEDPYFKTDYGETAIGASFFSANRQVPSPAMFGSLPTGVLSMKPWQTLLFRPGPTGHPGSDDPRDHYLLDLFWMPVAEPYAISEPFSTAGKVNMNYQILPFTYITRNTALRAVLSPEKVAQIGKVSGAYTRVISGSARSSLNLNDTDGTLRQFKERFSQGDIFRSATEICDIFLVPSGSSWTSDSAARTAWYGDNFTYVGDNLRERPYATIYPRVTTKSNTFRVYYTTQSLNNRSTNPAVWNESLGVVTGEYRGSTTIERYLNPADTNLPDAATDTSNPSLEGYYRWRIVEQTSFAP
ncbi:Verru_Chthon cassette protein A [Terrimicrobium sacchariphilum]|uniref:Verru_Chthon cassette protein A n=1 Tax=Terrimicrobium sacchariphilum TaxID=690879 RepID=A0A146GEZ8_TERSA|nr:Verru_Chthon cassette protein A [Terrimicrobium sacchariphilum]